jgi:cytochrome P450
MSETLLSPETYQPFDARTLSCPHAAWAMLRRESPVHKIDIPGMPVESFFVTRKQDLQYVCDHPEIFSSSPPAAAWRWGPDMGPDLNAIFDDGGWRPVHTFVTSDPPEHPTYRRVISAGMTPRKVDALAPAIQEIIDELTQALRSGETVDFMQAYAVPLPLRVIGIILGLPRKDDKFLSDFADAYMRMVDPTYPLEAAAAATREVVEGQRYLADLLLKYREAPADNLMSEYANARNAEGELMSLGEALSMATITVIGGNETTRHALGNCAYLLAKHPNLWTRLQRDRAKIPSFVEEALRTHAPSTATARGVRVDTELGGTKIPKGSCLYMLWGSGSVDEAAFADPQTVDLDRQDGRGHVSFGYGSHFCAGNRLARAELIQSVSAWLDAFERIELGAPEDEIAFAPILAFRSFHKLPLRFVRKSPA